MEFHGIVHIVSAALNEVLAQMPFGTCFGINASNSARKSMKFLTDTVCHISSTVFNESSCNDYRFRTSYIFDDAALDDSNFWLQTWQMLPSQTRKTRKAFPFSNIYSTTST